jgi:Holliday junction resolvasome RuvABC endonuclease subunit
MLILGLDPSQSTGWAIYDTKAELSAIRCGVLKAKAGKGLFEQNAGRLGFALVRLIKETGKPDFAVIEKAPRQPAGAFGGGRKTQKVKFMGADIPAQLGDEAEGGGGGLQSTLSTNQMAAAVCAILGAYQIPFQEMTSSEWRKPAYGFGTRKGWDRNDWKRHARQTCAQMRIAATNDDMAEACWIAFAGKSCDAVRKMEHDLEVASQRQARAA